MRRHVKLSAWIVILAAAGCQGSSSSSSATAPKTAVASSTSQGTTTTTTAAASPVSPPSKPVPAKFAFAVGLTGATTDLLSFTVDSAGTLKATGTPLSQPLTFGSNIAFADPLGRCVYLVNADQGTTVLPCTIDPATGTATPRTPVTIPNPGTGTSDIDMAFTPSGSFAYLTVNAGSIAEFAVSAAGDLTPLGAPLQVSSIVPSLSMDPSGQFLYAATPGGSAQEIAVFKIGPTGALAPMPGARLPGGDACLWARIHPDGKFLYALSNVGNIVTFSVAPTTGALTLASHLAVPAAADIAVLSSTLIVVMDDVDASGNPTGTYSLRSYALDQTTGAVGSQLGSLKNPDLGAFPVVDQSRGLLFTAGIQGGAVSLTGPPQAPRDGILATIAVGPQGQLTLASELPLSNEDAASITLAP